MKTSRVVERERRGYFSRPYSMRRNLIVTVLLAELVAALVISGMALIYERHAHFRSFDVMVHGRADSLLGAVQDAGDPANNVMLDRTGLNTPPEDVYEVRDEAGHVLGRSANWEGASAAVISPREDGFVRLQIGGQHFRGFRLHGVRVVDADDKAGGIRRRVTIVYASPTARVWRAVQATAGFYALVNLILLLVTGVVMAWLLNRGLAPLRLLAAEASRVSVNSWRFNAPASALMLKELAPLALALENVLEGLERSFTQQRRFVGDAAHELKTAVAVVKSSLQLLAMKPRSSVEYQEGLERCERDCDRMEEIVFKMLALARVDEGTQAAATATPTDLAACVRSVTEQFESMATLLRVRISVVVEEALLVAVGAADCALVVSNLVLNALQHSYADGEVTLSAGRQGDYAELRVEDGGDGIDAEVLPHVFERFFRGDASRDRSTGGTGLGLAICKGIVEQASGTIGIESTVNVGTAVTVRLPTVSTVR